MEHPDKQSEKDALLHHPLSKQQQIQRLHAPASLLTELENRLAQHDLYLISQLSEQDMVAALHHEQWEIRSAIVEALGVASGQTPHPLIVDALHDENSFVRITAVRALGKLGTYAPLPLLLMALRDHDWQVREVAVLTLGELDDRVSEGMLEGVLHDPNSNVREAAQLALRATQVPRTGHVNNSVSHRIVHFANKRQKAPKERRQTNMVRVPQDAGHQRGGRALFWHTSARGERKLRWSRQFGLAVAALVFLLFVLTAAGMISGWWNPLFGDSNLYQTIGQQQTSQGVTIKVTKVYADEGRTIIAYDIFSQDTTKNFFVLSYDLTSTTPQTHEILTSTQCDAPQGGMRHCYILQPAFQVPANINTLRLDWDVKQVAVDGDKNVFLSGVWHFSFAVPFHHENKHDIPNPLQGGTIN